MNALYTLEYEGLIAMHDDDSFVLLKSTALALSQFEATPSW